MCSGRSNLCLPAAGGIFVHTETLAAISGGIDATIPQASDPPTAGCQDAEGQTPGPVLSVVNAYQTLLGFILKLSPSPTIPGNSRL